MRYGLTLLLIVTLLVIVELILSPIAGGISRMVKVEEPDVTPLSTGESQREPLIKRGEPTPYTTIYKAPAIVWPDPMRSAAILVGTAMYGLALLSFYLARKRGTAYHLSLVARLLPVWYLSLSVFLVVYLGLTAAPFLVVAAWRMYVVLKSWRAVRKVLE